jgi:hypothetical protein
MDQKDAHDQYHDMSNAGWDDQAPSREGQRKSDLKQYHSPRQTTSERNAMRFKEVAEPANVDRMEQRVNGMGDKNEGEHNPDDIEAAARIMRGTAKPVSIHKAS